MLFTEYIGSIVKNKDLTSVVSPITLTRVLLHAERLRIDDRCGDGNALS